MVSQLKDFEFLSNLITLSHNLQTIKRDNDLPIYLIDDVTKYLRFQFGANTFCKILFNGLKSLQHLDNDVSLISDKIKSVSTYSLNIIKKQKDKFKNKKHTKYESNTNDNEEIEELTLCDIPDELLYHISSYLSLKQSLKLNELSYFMFKIFHKIPRYYPQQINDSNMSWFNSNKTYIINKCKAATNVDFHSAHSYVTSIDSNISHLSSFKALTSLTINTEIQSMNNLLNIIHDECKISKLHFKKKCNDHGMYRKHDALNVLFCDYMKKYGNDLSCLLIKDYALKSETALNCILSHCVALKQFRFQRNAFAESRDLPISLHNEFMIYCNKYIEMVECVALYRAVEDFQKFFIELLHNVKSYHLTYLADGFNYEFVSNYISKYNKHINTDQDIMEKIGYGQDIKIEYKESNILYELEEICLNVSQMDKYLFFWINLVIQNAKNLKRMKLMLHSDQFCGYQYEDHIQEVCEKYITSFIGFCLQNLESLIFGVLDTKLLKIFLKVFNSKYKYYPIFKKSVNNKNNIKYIELIFKAPKYFNKSFPWKKELIKLMKIMCLYQINWKIGIDIEGEIDDEFHNDVFDKVFWCNWPNYDRWTDSHWKKITFINEEKESTGEYRIIYYINKNDYITNQLYKCDNCNH